MVLHNSFRLQRTFDTLRMRNLLSRFLDKSTILRVRLSYYKQKDHLCPFTVKPSKLICKGSRNENVNNGSIPKVISIRQFCGKIFMITLIGRFGLPRKTRYMRVTKRSLGIRIILVSLFGIFAHYQVLFIDIFSSVDS